MRLSLSHKGALTKVALTKGALAKEALAKRTLAKGALDYDYRLRLHKAFFATPRVLHIPALRYF